MIQYLAVLGMLIVGSIVTDACAEDYEMVFENRELKGFIVTGSHTNKANIHTVSTKVTLKHNKKKMNTTIFEDYVLNCNENTFHVDHSKVYYNGNQIGRYSIYSKNADGDDEEIDVAFPLKLKSMYCGSNDYEPEPCTKLTYTSEHNRRAKLLMYKHYGTVLCE